MDVIGNSTVSVFSGFLALILGLFAATPAAALTDHEVDRLMDESARMRALVQRVQALNGPAPSLPGVGPELSAAGAAPAPTSAMLAAAQREQWLRSIERGVLGRFASDFEPAGAEAAPAAVGFVGGDEAWYGALRVEGQERRARPTDPLDVRARVLVAPRFEDGSFFHVGVSYRSTGVPDEAEEFLGLALPPAADDFRSGRYWGIDLGYAWDAYRVQAEYRQANLANGGARPPAAVDPATDGFYIQGAWRITGEPEAGRYAPGLLRHLTPRAEDGIWELVVRYASLNPAAAVAGGRRDSGSMLLGIHWRANSTLALELDYVEGNGEDFRALNDGGLTLRGTLSF